MSQFPQISIKHNIGNVITVPNQISSKVFTYLTSNVAIGALSLPVDNAIDFTAGVILLLVGSLGTENCEIVLASAHTDQAITVAALKMPHNRGELVQQITFDQVSVYKSATFGGSYTLLITNTFQVTQQNTVVLDATGLTSDYYKVQWKNSSTAGVSDFSDPISVLAYPENSVANIIFPVLRAMGVSDNDPKINTEFCLGAVDDARKYTDSVLFGIRQAWREKFEFGIKVLAGNNFVYLPDDIDEKFTDRSLLAARFLIGNVLAPFNLHYIDKRSWNQIAFSVMGGNAAEDVAIGATTIDLDNAGDFYNTSSNGGVAYVATTDYDQEIMQIGYTGVDYVNNQLTGVTGVTRAFLSGTRVWSNPTIAQPIDYTVYEDKLVFDRLIPDSMQANNVYIDYYKKLDKVTDLYQELPEPYRENYKWYLKYAIKYRKDINLPSDDPDLKKFEGLVKAVLDNLYTGQETTIVTG